jgi:hypothetical protein
MVNHLRDLPDEALELERALLSHKVSALRYATSAIGLSFLQQYRERLDAVRLELERRKT